MNHFYNRLVLFHKNQCLLNLSSTYETKEFAEFLGEKGYHTLTRNLPGHGASVEECNTVKYQDWLSFVEQDLAELSINSDKRLSSLRLFIYT